MGFGDTKIVPDVLPEMFEKIVKVSKAWVDDEDTMQKLWSSIKEPMVIYFSSKKCKVRYLTLYLSII